MMKTDSRDESFDIERVALEQQLMETKLSPIRLAVAGYLRKTMQNGDNVARSNKGNLTQDDVLNMVNDDQKDDDEQRSVLY